jgi:hypothetical protein
MEIVVNLKTTATHDKEYRGLEFSDWHPYITKEYKIGDTLPADSIFLGNTNGSLLFKILRPKPRPLPVIDNEIINKVSLYFHPDITTKSKLRGDLEIFVWDSIFTSDAERNWWHKYREFEIEMNEKLITVNIVGK